jgi:hypothetical protein
VLAPGDTPPNVIAQATGLAAVSALSKWANNTGRRKISTSQEVSSQHAVSRLFRRAAPSTELHLGGTVHHSRGPKMAELSPFQALVNGHALRSAAKWSLRKYPQRGRGRTSHTSSVS